MSRYVKNDLPPVIAALVSASCASYTFKSARVIVVLVCDPSPSKISTTSRVLKVSSKKGNDSPAVSTVLKVGVDSESVNDPRSN